MIKAMFFDLDGTLLGSDKRVPESARRALERCRARGIRLFLATGRSPRLREMLGWTPEQEALFDGGVFCNGACMVMPEGTSYLCLPSGVVRAVVEQVNAVPRLNVALQMDDNAHAFNHPLAEHAFGEWGIDHAPPICEGDYARTVKMLIYFENLIDSVTPIPQKLLEALAFYDGEARIYLTDAGKSVQIVSRDASKLLGVERIRQGLGFSRDEIAVFGDDMNDLEMIAGFPNSVAMGNACEEIKEKAGFVTRGNDEDGIAWAVERLLGKPERENEEEKKGGVFQSACAGYAVRPLGQGDVEAILRLYSGNPQFFEAMSSPATRESVLGDLTAPPPGKTSEDKHFLGFYDGETLIAVMDWVDGYPDRQTAFIGLFMVEAAFQGRGVGSVIVRDGLEKMARAGFKRVRLGYVETNGQSEAFWRKNGFAPTGERVEREKYTIVVAQRNLRS